MIEGVTNIVKDLADWISKLDPKIVETTMTTAGWVAGLSLLGKGIGGAVKGVGDFMDTLSTVSGWLGKLTGGSKGASDAVGGIAEAVGKASGGIGGLSSAIGGASGTLSGFSSLAGALFNPVTGIIAGSIAVIGGVTWALEENEKQIKKNTDEFTNAENKYSSFKGRVEGDGNWWESTFGKKIEIEFSSNLPEVVEESQQHQSTMLNDLANYYVEKDKIDHDGCEDEETHQKHRQELEEKYAKILEEINGGKAEEYKKTLETNTEEYKQYLMTEKGMTEEGAQAQAEAWKKYGEGKLETYNKNFEEIIALTEKCNGDIESLDAESQARLQELLAQNTEIETDIINAGVEDRANIYKKENEVIEENRIKERKAMEEDRERHEKYTEDVTKAYHKQSQEYKTKVAQVLEGLDRSDFASEEAYQAELKRQNNLIDANSDFTDRFSKEVDSRIKSGMDYQTAHSSAFYEIVKDLQNGAINVEEFGMTEEEYMAQALDAMIEAGAGADELTGAIQRIPKEKRADVIANVKNKDTVDSLKWSIDSLYDRTVYVNVVGYENATAARYSHSSGMVAGRVATGGHIQNEGVYLTNERNIGFELIDTPNDKNVMALSSTLEGDYAYLPQGTQVYTNLQSTEMMKAEIRKEIGKYQGNITYNDLQVFADRIISAIRNYANVDINIDNDFNIEQTIDSEFEEQRLSNNIGDVISSELRRFGKIVTKK